MACCGARRMVRQAQPASSPPRVVNFSRTANAVPSAVFELVTARAIVVTGPCSGAVYRFAGPGARVTVHRLDAASLMSVPGLRPVSPGGAAQRRSERSS